MREKENANKVQQTSSVVVGGGQAGAMLSLLLARGGVPVERLDSYGDLRRNFDRDAVHPAVMEVLEELGLAEHGHQATDSGLPSTLPTVLVVPAGQSLIPRTAEPASPNGPEARANATREGPEPESSAKGPDGSPSSPEGTEGVGFEAANDRGNPGQRPVPHDLTEQGPGHEREAKKEDVTERSEFELGRAQGRIELLEQELERRERELDGLRRDASGDGTGRT